MKIEQGSDRNQMQIKRKSNKNGTESCVNIVNAAVKIYNKEYINAKEAEEQKLEATTRPRPTTLFSAANLRLIP